MSATAWMVSLLLLAGCGLLILLGWSIRRKLSNWQRAISLVSAATNVHVFRHSFPRADEELERARRYGRPLTLIVLSHSWGEAAAASAHRNGTRNGAHNGNGTHNELGESRAGAPTDLFRHVAASFLFLGHVLRASVRESDLVAYNPALHGYMLALPETHKAEALLVVARLQDCAARQMVQLVAGGTAEFPHDGLTLEDLLKHARDGRQGEPLWSEPVMPANRAADSAGLAA